MSSKEQTHSNYKQSSKQPTPQRISRNLDRLTPQQTPLAPVIQQAALDPRLLTPRNMLQLQRIIGNQQAGQFLTQPEQGQPIQRLIIADDDESEDPIGLADEEILAGINHLPQEVQAIIWDIHDSDEYAMTLDQAIEMASSEAGVVGVEEDFAVEDLAIDLVINGEQQPQNQPPPLQGEGTNPEILLYINGHKIEITKELAEVDPNKIIWACYALMNTPFIKEGLLKIIHEKRWEPAEWLPEVQDYLEGITEDTLQNAAVIVSQNEQFSTEFIPDQHAILVPPEKNKTEALRKVLFELCNASFTDIYGDINTKVAEGQLGCITYVWALERQEYESEQRYNGIIDLIIQNIDQLGDLMYPAELEKFPLKSVLARLQDQLGEMQVDGSHAANYAGAWFTAYAAKYIEQHPTQKKVYTDWLNNNVGQPDEQQQYSLNGIQMQGGEYQLIKNVIKRFIDENGGLAKFYQKFKEKDQKNPFGRSK